ncbi:RNase HI [Tindallia magadiensis]|uniref:Ribonuclease H n=1 Tax=Tindallia magadiensis TaxID=69895 RepID=A0A1I3FGK0_9FIRM|nr:ribonuclease HI [Tindallia magadiensis]SFI10335.1 RNase HI [Tindallia magadiensis]
MKKVEIYTDGGALGNPGKGGYGAILVYGEHRKEIAGGYQHTTNNRMEMMACIKALETLKEPCEVDIFSDSKYLVDSVMKGWAKRWQANNWKRNKKDKAENSDLWKKLLELLEMHKVTLHWVKGHNGHPENERCDEMVKEAADKENLPIDAGYQK